MGRETLSEWRTGAPLRVRDLMLVPLERLRITVSCDGRRLYADAGKHAAGVVIVDADGARAMDHTGQPLDIDDLATRVAGLREWL